MNSTASRALVLAAALARTSPALSAEDPLARCEAAVRGAPGDREAWRCFEIEGQPKARYEDAKTRLERRLSARPGDPFPALALGRLEAGRGAERAVELLSASAEGFARLSDDAGQAQALSGQVRFLGFKRRNAEAQVVLRSLRTLAGRSRGPEARVELAVAEAGLAQLAGDYGREWTLLRGVEGDVLAHGHSVLRRVWLSSFAYVGWATGRLDEALAAYRRLAAMLREEGDRFRLAFVLSDQLSVMTSGIASPEERRRTAEDAFDAARDSGNVAAESAALAYLAEFGGPGPAAAAAVARALELARESGDGRSIAMAQRAVALYGEPAAAEGAFREALARAERLHDRDETARTLVVRSRALWTTGPRGDAIASSITAMDAAEATRDLQPDSLTRARRFAQWARPYMELGGHMLAGDLLPPGSRPSDEDYERAFTTTERMRARVLLDELDASRTSADLFVVGADGRRRDEALRAISGLQEKLRSLPSTGAERDDVLAALARLEREEANLREKLASADPGFASVRRPLFPTLREIRAGLAPDEALLVYAIGDAPPSDGPTWGATSWVLAVTRGSVAAHRVPDELTLSSKVTLFVGLLDERRGEEEEGAVRLYGDLLQSAVDALPHGVRRIVIVPDRILHMLPFAALRPTREAEPFGESFEVSVAPSATVWWAERRQPVATLRRGVLVLADPTRDASPRTAGAAPERGLPALPQLVHAHEEGASAIRRIGRQSLLLAGAEAAEAALRAAGPDRFRVLHFAAHALLDDAHPDRSAIVLAPGRAGEDGLLHLREIASLKLPGSVVVVSGCRSAGGVVLGGEGPMGLARAFFQAGARAVVGSLRPLRDDEAAAFFDRFYARLARGASVAGAVRGAQTDRRRAGAPAAAWAGIVTLGDGGSVPFPRDRWPWLAAAVFVAAAGGVLGSRFFRRAT